MSSRDCDVVIAGGGPAGAATALALRSHAPSLSVVLVEASSYQRSRLGETLAPVANRLLTHLQVGEAFRRQHHLEVCGSVSVWGAEEAYENDFIYATRGDGWHLDRTRFDAMLAEQAERRGVCLLRDTRVRHIERDGSCWRALLSGGTRLRARFAVDATGSRAAIARRQRARVVTLDRLAGFAQFFTEKRATDPRTLIEAFADGWWYTAGLPGARRVVVCMTDSDIARRLELNEFPAWCRLLKATTRTRQTVRGADPCGPLMIRAAGSRVLDEPIGQGWLAVGDAASVFDPLSSQGIVKALRSGVFAAYAIADSLRGGTALGLQRYRRYVSEEFEGYARTRAGYYAEERRWPDREFWQRRGSGGRDPVRRAL